MSFTSHDPQIKSTHSILGKTVEERERSLGRLLNEVNIIKEQVSTFLYGVIVTSGASKAGPSSSVHMIALLECFEPIPLVVQLKSLL